MSDIIFSIVMIFYSVYLFLESSRLPEGIANMPGPGFFPKLVSIVVFFLSCFLIVMNIWNVVKGRKKGPSVNGRWLRVFLIIACIFLYIFAWGKGNFLINTFALLFSIQILTGSKWYIALIGSTVLSFSVFLLFGKVFNVLFF